MTKSQLAIGRDLDLILHVVVMATSDARLRECFKGSLWESVRNLEGVRARIQADAAYVRRWRDRWFLRFGRCLLEEAEKSGICPRRGIQKADFETKSSRPELPRKSTRPVLQKVLL